MTAEWIKEVSNWEKEYLTMEVELSKRQRELLEGGQIQSNEGMVYGGMYSDWKKNRSCTITNSGYDAYFGISSTALAQDVEFDVDDEATKAQIKRAFVKSLKTKKLNKKVLGEFIELVA